MMTKSTIKRESVYKNFPAHIIAVQAESASATSAQSGNMKMIVIEIEEENVKILLIKSLKAITHKAVVLAQGSHLMSYMRVVTTTFHHVIMGMLVIDRGRSRLERTNIERIIEMVEIIERIGGVERIERIRC